MFGEEGGSKKACTALHVEGLRFHPEGIWKQMKVFSREMHLRMSILASAAWSEVSKDCLIHYCSTVSGVK